MFTYNKYYYYMDALEQTLLAMVQGLYIIFRIQVLYTLTLRKIFVDLYP